MQAPECSAQGRATGDMATHRDQEDVRLHENWTTPRKTRTESVLQGSGAVGASRDWLARSSALSAALGDKSWNDQDRV